MTGQSWVFGTDEDCDVRISDDPYVSNHHCKIILTDDGTVLVEDLGSTNGTWIKTGNQVFGTQVYGPTILKPGWIIRIGRTEIPWRDGPTALR